MACVVSIVGPSGSGKTYLLERLIRELTQKGLSVAAVKFTHHGFALDRPGKDSYRLKQAGAASVGVVSPGSWAVIADQTGIAFDDLLIKLPPSDMVITEGGTGLDTPKIEIIPPSFAMPTKSPPGRLIALVGKDIYHEDIPCFDRDDISGIAEFLIGYFK